VQSSLGTSEPFVPTALWICILTEPLPSPDFVLAVFLQMSDLRCAYRMKLDFKGERVLAVVAHPDDAELFCAGTLARAQRDGAVIGICILCQGDKGQPSERVANLASVRRKEVKAAADLLGAELFLSGWPDGTLADDREGRRKLTELFRKFKPSLVLAHPLEDYHPDHKAASALTEAVSWFCAARGHKTASPAIRTPPALWWMDTMNMNCFAPGFYVDITDFVPLKTQMLACHSSQLQRGKDADFSPLAEMLRLQFRTRGAQAGVEAAEAFRAHCAFKRTRAW
jgi:LmbE family N-acetylglucosaminyl deacetylase